MMTASDARRRGLGLLFLAAALGMLVMGLTVLNRSLEGWAFLLYWLGCFAFTLTAMLVAFVDLWAIRQRTRDEQRDLIQHTLEDADEAQERKSREAGE
jgi:hypothetical protein